jgi:hypothetical protein
VISGTYHTISDEQGPEDLREKYKRYRHSRGSIIWILKYLTYVGYPVDRSLTMAAYVGFDFTYPDDVHPSLRSYTIGSSGEDVIQHHLGPLDQLADRLHVTKHALENAKRLATGHKGVVVVLLEPSDIAEDMSYEPMFTASTALQYVDKSLRFAFNGNRCVDNTIVFDIRAFQSARFRKNHNENERH